MKLTKLLKILITAIFFTAVSAGVIWYAVLKENRGEILTVAFMDVGQGDAIFIEAPNGNQMLIDGGPNGAILRELGKIMPFYDKKIDVLVVTNPDKDHFAGFLDVLKRYEVSMVIEPGTKSSSETYRAFSRAVDENEIEKVTGRYGMSLVLDEERGIFFEIIFPDRDVSSWKTNDGSIVARLIYASTSVMFTGDTTQKIERYIKRAADGRGKAGREEKNLNLKSDVLKVAHHGSKTSSLKEFVDAVAPKYSVISVGRNNRYNHPNKETIDTLEASGIKIFRTDRAGTIIMKTDGRSMWFSN